MASRKSELRIGLLLTNDDIGVIYYLLNIVKCLNELRQSEMPCLCLFFDSPTFKHSPLFEFYKNLEIYQIEYPSPPKFYLKSLMLRRNYYLDKLVSEKQLSGLFPTNDIPFKIKASGNYKAISWVPDFQHKFYPKFFSKKNLLLREMRFKKVLKNSSGIVLSSQNAKDHVNKFYKKVIAPIHVLNFVSHVELNTKLDIEDLKVKFNIKRPYFIISNQFYQHKNHGVVFKAIAILKEMGITNFDFVFTGKKYDYRNKEYFATLEQYIMESEITNEIKILGLIEREEQLVLMKMAEAIIQPSLFEGWNTSIEDAKKLNQVIICSSIEVHKEQLSEFAYYFSPEDPYDLVCILKKFLVKGQKHPIYPNDHLARVNIFAQQFLTLYS